MPKKFGTNSKAADAREKKQAEKKIKNAEDQKKKEESKWQDDGTKILKAKEERKLSKEEKKQAELARKQENKKLYEEEMLTLKSKNKAPSGKITQAEVERERQKALMATLMKNVSKDLGNNENDFEGEIEENINHILREQESEDKERYDQVINADNLDEAFDNLNFTGADRHPEKRVKAAFRQYVDDQLPLMKKENPSLKRSQHLQIIRENWKKAKENPFNKQVGAYNQK